MELLAEDSAVSAGDTPAAAVQSSARTVWLMATVVLRGGTSAPPTLPGAPTGVGVSAGDGTAVVSWTAPSNGDAVRREYRPGVEHRHRYPAGHHGDRHRADRRHRVHVHGHRHQRGRYRS